MLARLRIGDTFLTHGFLLRGEDPWQCRLCYISLSHAPYMNIIIINISRTFIGSFYRYTQPYCWVMIPSCPLKRFLKTSRALGIYKFYNGYAIGALGNLYPIVLFFGIVSHPDKIKIGYLTADVWPYVPNLLRCFKCNRFGYAAGACRGTHFCARCIYPGRTPKNARIRVCVFHKNTRTTPDHVPNGSSKKRYSTSK